MLRPINSILDKDEDNRKLKSFVRRIISLIDDSENVETAKIGILTFINRKENLGEVKGKIAEITTRKGNLTLGQYFYQKYIKGEKIRDTYTHREEHYLDEFNRICKFQNIPDELKNKLRKAIFYQRPFKSQKGLIGKCVFETNKPRCAVSRPEFEEYRMLCFINNIKIKTPADEKLRQLNNAEREKIIPQFFRKSKEHFDFEDLAKQLAPKKQYKYYRERKKYPEDYLLNYSMKTTVSGCPVSARFKELFGENFIDGKFNYIKDNNGRTPILISDAWHALYTFDSDERLKKFGQKHLGFNDEQCTSFLKMRLKQDFASLSLKAINKVLPYLREGLIYSHAVFLGNMEETVPIEIWGENENKEIIRNAIKELIENHADNTKIKNLVNGFITNARREANTWSEEAKPYYFKELDKKIKAVLGTKKFESFSEFKKNNLTDYAQQLIIEYMPKNLGKGEHIKIERLDEAVLSFLENNFGEENINAKKLYHPSAVETYKPSKRGKDGKLYLGSPMTSSVRNPMAMRALHQLRLVINELIKEGIINTNTKVNIEMSRGLLNANERAGLKRWQNERETKRKEYVSKIKEFYTADYQPSEDEILKYQLWEEQRRNCLYTGKQINIEEFLGANPKYDIEHTVPRSQSYDNSQENKTLCESEFNQKIKKNKIPYELSNHSEILMRIEFWREKYLELEKQISLADFNVKKNSGNKEQKDKYIRKRHELKFECNYWRNKYNRFTLKEVPEGFKNSQMVDIGIITKYSRLYLKTVFPKVYTVKGKIVADFRIMWGLQNNYTKKARVNHIHHCIDAITIACIDKGSYETLANFYYDWEELHNAGANQLPPVQKPWGTFTEDVKEIENQILVSHYNSDNLPKQSKKKIRVRGKIQYKADYKKDKDGNILKDNRGRKIVKNYHYKTIFDKEGSEKKVKVPFYEQGDSVRGSLHKDTFYGAIANDKDNVIQRDNNEQVIPNYVVRKMIVDLKKSEIEKIVDTTVKGKIRDAIKNKILVLATSDTGKNKIDGSIWMNEEKKIPIKKVRIYQPQVKEPLKIKMQRDKNRKRKFPYKEHYRAVNGGNYLMAIFEKENSKGKLDRDYKILNNLEAGEAFKLSTCNEFKRQSKPDLINNLLLAEEPDFQLVQVVKPGKMVLVYKETPSEIWEMTNEEKRNRLYVIRGVDSDGIKLYFHKEARPTTDVIKAMNDYINSGYERDMVLDVRRTKKELLKEGVELKSEKEIKPFATEKDGQYWINHVDNYPLCSVSNLQPYLKVSKLTTPKGGDVIGKGYEFPYIKFKASNFNALIEGIDFKISPLGKITQITTNPSRF